MKRTPIQNVLLQEIKQCNQQGYSYFDMVVLVRKKKQADLIAKGSV